MARKASLTLENLTELGAEKLAALVMDEAGRNATFKRLASAALASKAGPEAVAKIADRRIAALEKARSFIEWDKARAFRNDLASLVSVIEAELVPAAPALALDRLLRFIATHERVFERVDDSNGAVQDVYHQAVDLMGLVTLRLDAVEAGLVPARIMTALGTSGYGYLVQAAEAVVPHLPDAALGTWDDELEQGIAARAKKPPKGEALRGFDHVSSQWGEIRQLIADQRGNLDLLIELELEKPEHMRNTQEIAEKLLEGGRLEEALDWVRREEKGTRIRVLTSYSVGPSDGIYSERRSALEARILDAMGDRAAARDVLWAGFKAGLSAELLRQHLKLLPDFEDMEAEEAALKLALGHKHGFLALEFFLDWQRPDLAAQLIVERREEWDGRDWHVLPEVAETLEHEYPLAATILYRALLDDVLARARSKAYGHGARHLRQLGLIAEAAEADPARQGTGIVTHETYLAEISSVHKRKSGFWEQVKKYSA